MTPIRILELRSVWGTGGGPDKTILSAAARADRARTEITVCYIRDARDTVFTLDRRAREVGVDYAEIIERHSFDPRIWPALRALVRQRRIDIIHAHDHKTDLLAWAVARRERLIPLSTAHGFAGDSYSEQFYYAVEKRLLSRFPRVIAVSNPIRAELIRTGSNPARIVVINNAIDHLAFSRDRTREPAARRTLGFGESQVVIGAVGRLESEKRFDLLIEAFSTLRASYPSAVLAIAGEGRLRPALEAQIERLGLQQSVRLLGHVGDVVMLHHAFDLFVQSSEREGTPNSVLEAMALETPIVATDVGGTRELVADGLHGRLVPRHDVPALAAAMRETFADPERAHLRAAAARARVESELSFDRRVQRVEELYVELAGGRNRS